MLEICLALRLSVSIYLPYPHFLVPARSREEVCRGVEANVGDAVFRWLVDRDILREVALCGV